MDTTNHFSPLSFVLTPYSHKLRNEEESGGEYAGNKSGNSGSARLAHLSDTECAGNGEQRRHEILLVRDDADRA